MRVALVVIWERLADCKEGQGFCQPVDLGNLPAQFALHAFDRR